MLQRWAGIRRRIAALFAVTVFALAFASCRGDPSGKIFRYDIQEKVENLDPQFAVGNGTRMILSNLYEGLVTQSPEGEILPGVASSYALSEDRLTYRFTLREDAAWSNGDSVTAADFVFAFQRMFRDRSPHAELFLAIKGARDVLAGSAPISSLEVREEGERNLVIRLAAPDPLFLEHLTDPAASPCNERAYQEARGRYGLEGKLICGNGPFVLNEWSENRLLLRRSESYRSELPTQAGGVNFYIGREGDAQFLDGKTDLAQLNWEQIEQLNGRARVIPIQKTVWCIVFNQNHPLWGNPLLRQGLAYTVDPELMAKGLPGSFQPATQLAPGAMRVVGKPFRELAGTRAPIEYSAAEGKRLFELGLSMLAMEQLPSTATICVPERGRLALNVGQLQQGWQRDLEAYMNFEVTSVSEIQNKLRSGDYQMLILPMTPANSNIRTLLGAFTSDSGQNYFGYRNALYDELLETAANQVNPQQAAERYAQAETILLSDAVVIPLFYETTYLAESEGVRDLGVSVFGDRIYFKYALKD